jgi:Na+-driven multidrug efflux pump
MLVLAAVKVMASYILIGKLGIAGAPIGTTVSYALAFATSLLLLRFSTGISPFVFLHLVRPTLSSVLAVEIGRAFYDAFSKGNNEVLLFFICVIVCVALYFIFMILLSMISVKKILNFVRINKKKDA